MALKNWITRERSRMCRVNDFRSLRLDNEIHFFIFNLIISNFTYLHLSNQRLLFELFRGIFIIVIFIGHKVWLLNISFKK